MSDWIELTDQQLERYARHLTLSWVGEEGQRALLDAKVLIVGAGGLGSAVSLYLAVSGVGTIGLVDHDLVALTNLQRQTLYRTVDVGRSKTASAAETLRARNPDVVVAEHNTRLSSDNALDLVAAYDLVVDATDNFPTRYLINDACILTGRPLVWGAVLQFDGQLSVVRPRQGPCYRCIFPNPPPPEQVPTCVDVGVLGVTPGVLGTLQAMEAIKLLLGIGEAMIGRILLFDGLTMTFSDMPVQRDPACAVCGDQPSVTELIDYEAFCGWQRSTP